MDRMRLNDGVKIVHIFLCFYTAQWKRCGFEMHTDFYAGCFFQTAAMIDISNREQQMSVAVLCAIMLYANLISIMMVTELKGLCELCVCVCV